MKFQPPRGTRDFLPEQMIKREFIIETIKKVFEKYGFEPLETPAFENFELFTSKGAGGEEIRNQIYCFKDKSNRELGLKFDLTVPMCRVIANNPQLIKPFKRYQIERVWRYEEVRKDRFREFLQCDIDIAGTSEMDSEAEILAMLVDCLESLGFKNFSIKLNTRKILSGLIELINAQKTESFDVFRAIDKIEKFGEETVREELINTGLDNWQIDKLFELITLKGALGVVLKKAEKLFQKIPIGLDGVKELKHIVELSKAYNITEKIMIDFSLARGLDYYTGPIFEAVASEGIGSLAGGGRYDKMIELFGGKPIPSTGISFGVERIYEVMKKSRMFKINETKTKVFAVVVKEKLKRDVIKIAQELRKNGINVQIEIMNRSLRKQLDYANKKKIPYSLFVGEKELKENKFTLRDMKTGKEEKLKLNNIIKKLTKKMTKL